MVERKKRKRDRDMQKQREVGEGEEKGNSMPTDKDFTKTKYIVMIIHISSLYFLHFIKLI